MKDATIIVRVDKETKDKLEKLAEKDRRKLSDYVRIVLEDASKKKA